MPNTINVHVIVDASLAGIESVRIRVPQGHRAAGLQFLDQLLPARPEGPEPRGEPAG